MLDYIEGHQRKSELLKIESKIKLNKAINKAKLMSRKRTNKKFKANFQKLNGNHYYLGTDRFSFPIAPLKFSVSST